MHIPHERLAIESLADPKEVWWLNAFASEVCAMNIARGDVGCGGQSPWTYRPGCASWTR